jgi:hypothetical protein
MGNRCFRKAVVKFSFDLNENAFVGSLTSQVLPNQGDRQWLYPCSPGVFSKKFFSAEGGV